MQLPKLLVYTITASMFCAGCFHKDVETDRADDVTATLLYEGPGGPVLLNKEEIFQANSKSSEGGVTHISGYSEMRLSAYALQSGELLARVPLGEMMEEANALLGYSPGKVWMFSLDPALGLHWRDPRTLAVKADWPTLQQQPGLKGFRPARPDWPLIDQYFAFHWESGRIMLTDEAGFRYLLDPESLSLEKTELRMPRVNWDPQALSNNGQFSEDMRFSLNGDSRKVIEGLGKASDSRVSFLFGSFLLDGNPRLAAERSRNMEAGFARRRLVLQDSLARMLAADSSIADAPAWSPFNSKKRDAHRAYTHLQDDLRRLEHDEQHHHEFGKGVLSSPLLTEDGRTAYIFHADLIADTARAHVSQVRLLPDSTWQLAWDTRLHTLYHNASKADQAGAFEEVFSSGNPKFDYFWAGIAQGHLVLIGQLRMICLNVKTGKVVWEVEL